MRRIVLQAVLFAAAATTAVQAQYVSGIVVDAETGVPIADVLVSLANESGLALLAVETSTMGTFTMRSNDRVASVRASHVAYDDVSLSVRPARAGTVSVELLLHARSVDLPEIAVEAGRLSLAERRGYEGRRSVGAGRFFSRDDIERRRATVITDLLSGIPGIDIRDGDFRITRVRGWGQCAPTVVLNDVVQRRRGQEMGIRIDDLARPADVYAVEVYTRGAGLPAQYGGRESPCGAILIWTDR